MARKRSIKATSNDSAKAVIFVKPPSSETVAPAVPAGFVPTHRADYRGSQPKLAELAVLPDCVTEIQRFADYIDVFGKTAPPADHVAQAFEASGQWSAQRRLADEWSAFVGTQEGVAWKATRVLLEGLRGPFRLASTRDPSLSSSYPNLTRLFSIAKETAKKAVATKARDAKAAHAKAAQASAPTSNESAPPAKGTNGALLN